MELESHNRGDASRLSRESFLHNLSDYRFSVWTSIPVISWPEIGGNHRREVEDKDQKQSCRRSRHGSNCVRKVRFLPLIRTLNGREGKGRDGMIFGVICNEPEIMVRSVSAFLIFGLICLAGIVTLLD